MPTFSTASATLPSSTRSEKQHPSHQSKLGSFLWYLKHLFIFLLPSFVQARLFSPDAHDHPRTLPPTAYLDGLRGLAALFVFFFHFTNNVYDQIIYSYGAPPSEQYGPNDGLLQLPIVKIFYSGPAAVSVFFVVSGFALSIKPLKHMRAYDDAGLLAALNSAAFRRIFRLFLPCFISTFVVFVAARLRLFEMTRFVAENHDILTGRPKLHIFLKENFVYQFWDWLTQAVDMVKMFYWGKDEYQGFSSDYDTHLWTIPIEFRSSMALFVTHLALARFRPAVRISIVLFLCVYAANNDRWEMLLFWGGLVLAEATQALREAATLSLSASRRGLWNGFLIANFVSGLYLASYPDVGAEETPGYDFLAPLVPENYSQQHRFWQGIGALQIVLSVSTLPALSRAFSSTLPHYLGQISYALYLIHALVNHTAGYWLLYWMYRLTGGWETPLKKAVGFALALVLDTLVAIWAADVFWRFGDRPCVTFAKWLESKCLGVKARS